MLSSLIATKLYIPPMRPDHVSRPRLVDYLDSGYRAGRRLTLVSAPAGYGKTSLMSEWQARLTGRQIPLAWLALEENDNDPLRFMHYILAAVRKVYPRLGQELLGMLDLPQPPSPIEIAGGLINEIAALASPLVLALDDFHLVTTPAIHEVIGFLIDRGPINLHLVIASRHDPLLPLPRLRARGQVTEVRLKDLRFRTDEAATFLRNSMGLELAETNLNALQERTEGWAAGLQLAAISLADGETSSVQFIESFTGDNRHILDYLLEEVLVRQPAEIQRFLLDTSVLEKFCACLCDVVVQEGEPDPDDPAAKACLETSPSSETAANNHSQRILDYLDRANLFLIPLDNRREYFRYHHLFREALRHRLQHQNPGRVEVLHRRAARWFDQNRLPAPAFEHAIAAGDSNLAADIAERWLDPVTFDGQIYQARAWIQALPEALLERRPEILFRKARMHAMRGEASLSLQTLDQLQRCLETFPDPFPRRPHLWTLNFTSRTAMAESRGDLAAATAYIEQAAQWLPPDDQGLQALIVSYHGYILRSQGELRQAESTQMEMFRISLQYKSFLGVFDGLAGAMWAACDQGQARRALQMGEDFLREYHHEIKDLPAVGIVYERMGEIAYYLNRLSDAEVWLEKAFEWMKQGGITDNHGYFRHRLAAVKWAAGKEAEVEPLLREADQWLRRSLNPRNKLYSGAVRARVRLLQGNLSEAASWVKTYLPEVDKIYRQDFQDDTLAWIWLSQGSALEALHFLESRQAGLEVKGIALFLIENLAIQALALQRLGSQSEALEKIQRALHMAEPEGLDRIFLDLGFEMVLLLTRLKTALGPNDHLQAYSSQLLSGFPEKDRGSLPSNSEPVGQPASTGSDEWVEGLSEREVEVLRWMARGLSNMQIAEQMVVAESTVKKHINHIFGKLGVENRTQALIKARERGLL